jgi:hypothetical protein
MGSGGDIFIQYRINLLAYKVVKDRHDSTA